MSVTVFGTTLAGDTVHKISLSAGDLSVSILTLGAILQDVRLAGVDYSLTLGGNDLAAYEGPMNYYGALVGPVANRISGARAIVDGVTCNFPANEGQNTLHSGPNGTHAHLWDVVNQGDEFVELALDLPTGLGGFPGQRSLIACYRLTPPAALTLEVRAATDAPTLINIANHSYWNLDGRSDTNGHRLHVSADHYLAVDEHSIPTVITDVTGTVFDYRDARAIGTGSGNQIDHNFCLSDARQPLRHVATLSGSSSLTLDMDTTEPGLQVYDAAKNDSAPFSGHTGQTYGPNAGIALEAQGWPDAPNKPGFPSVLVTPQQPYSQTTCWRFSQNRRP